MERHVFLFMVYYLHILISKKKIHEVSMKNSNINLHNISSIKNTTVPMDKRIKESRKNSTVFSNVLNPEKTNDKKNISFNNSISKRNTFQADTTSCSYHKKITEQESFVIKQFSEMEIKEENKINVVFSYLKKNEQTKINKKTDVNGKESTNTITNKVKEGKFTIKIGDNDKDVKDINRDSGFLYPAFIELKDIVSALKDSSDINLNGSKLEEIINNSRFLQNKTLLSNLTININEITSNKIDITITPKLKQIPKIISRETEQTYILNQISPVNDELADIQKIYSKTDGKILYDLSKTVSTPLNDNKYPFIIEKKGSNEYYINNPKSATPILINKENAPLFNKLIDEIVLKNSSKLKRKEFNDITRSIINIVNEMNQLQSYKKISNFNYSVTGKKGKETITITAQKKDESIANFLHDKIQAEMILNRNRFFGIHDLKTDSANSKQIIVKSNYGPRKSTKVQADKLIGIDSLKNYSTANLIQNTEDQDSKKKIREILNKQKSSQIFSTTNKQNEHIASTHVSNENNNIQNTTKEGKLREIKVQQNISNSSKKKDDFTLKNELFKHTVNMNNSDVVISDITTAKNNQFASQRGIQNQTKRNDYLKKTTNLTQSKKETDLNNRSNTSSVPENQRAINESRAFSENITGKDFVNLDRSRGEKKVTFIPAEVKINSKEPNKPVVSFNSNTSSVPENQRAINENRVFSENITGKDFVNLDRNRGEKKVTFTPGEVKNNLAVKVEVKTDFKAKSQFVNKNQNSINVENQAIFFENTDKVNNNSSSSEVQNGKNKTNKINDDSIAKGKSVQKNTSNILAKTNHEMSSSVSNKELQKEQISDDQLFAKNSNPDVTSQKAEVLEQSKDSKNLAKNFDTKADGFNSDKNSSKNNSSNSLNYNSKNEDQNKQNIFQQKTASPSSQKYLFENDKGSKLRNSLSDYISSEKNMSKIKKELIKNEAGIIEEKGEDNNFLLTGRVKTINNQEIIHHNNLAAITEKNATPSTPMASELNSFEGTFSMKERVQIVENLMNKLSDRVFGLTKKSDGEKKMILNITPDALGNIKIELNQKNNKFDISFEFTNPETKALLEKESEHLKEILKEKNVNISNIEMKENKNMENPAKSQNSKDPDRQNDENDKQQKKNDGKRNGDKQRKSKEKSYVREFLNLLNKTV